MEAFLNYIDFPRHLRTFGPQRMLSPSLPARAMAAFRRTEPLREANSAVASGRILRPDIGAMDATGLEFFGPELETAARTDVRKCLILATKQENCQTCITARKQCFHPLIFDLPQ